jgi:hypothetical protein
MTTDEVLKALGRYTEESCESEASDGNKTRLGPKVESWSRRIERYEGVPFWIGERSLRFTTVYVGDNCRKHAVHKKVKADAAKQKNNAASTKQVSETKK